MVGVAVIGVGRMGRVHARNLQKHNVKGARLVAICDVHNIINLHSNSHRRLDKFYSCELMLPKTVFSFSGAFAPKLKASKNTFSASAYLFSSLVCIIASVSPLFT